MKVIRFKDISYIPASHEDPQNPGVWKKVLFKKEDFAQGSLQMINWAKLPIGKAFTKHYHENMEEVFIVLQGRAEITIADEKTELEKGDAVFIPAGKTHQMRNAGSVDVFYMVIGNSQNSAGRTVAV